jgi:hypothetical protein
MDIDRYQSVILAFEMTLESIVYGLQMTTSLLEGNIKPDALGKEGLPSFINPIEWQKHPEAWKEQAQGLSMAIIGYWMCVITEGYFDLFEGKVADSNLDSDLCAAQMILKIVRNSLAHPHVTDRNQVKIIWRVRERKYQKRWEIEKLGVTLDATELNGKIFNLVTLIGWDKFIKLLRYLQSDLKERMSRNWYE